MRAMCDTKAAVATAAPLRLLLLHDASAISRARAHIRCSKIGACAAASERQVAEATRHARAYATSASASELHSSSRDRRNAQLMSRASLLLLPSRLNKSPSSLLLSSARKLSLDNVLCIVGGGGDGGGDGSHDVATMRLPSAREAAAFKHS